ncbi:hypothetical protein RD792_017651 [Penstemon davidsonii]|uniref:SBP-type domain-containing protein n=1 Tax=Penstemon davidsonii TaxID=160366 RepID=A0ABR0CPC4_9LAMI|nr:hypothetical protein RD792_017651 [Penstemon davidsonii]
METKLGGKLHNFYGPVVSDLKAMGKKSMEWDLNEWSWDGDMLRASPLNSVPSDCRSRQFFPVGSDTPVNNGASNSFSSRSDEAILENEREKRDLEKRRRIVEVEDEHVNEEARSLNLKLGGQVYPITEGELDKLEGQNGKKTKVNGSSSTRAVCQVEDCKADLSNAKDYHRRHKVCDVHSKATRALVGNVMQRFCQQCSRFHVLQEFDEGKRSCRRRLAGHNKRRRKTHPENEINAANMNDERANSSEQTKDQDLLSHLLRNLASFAGTTNERNADGSLAISQGLQNVGTSSGIAIKDPTRTLLDNAQGGVIHSASPSQYVSEFAEKASNSMKENGSVGRTKLNNFDLNSVYDGSQDCMDDTIAPEDHGNLSPVGPLGLYKDSQRSSPPQNSRSSGSTLSQSPSTSSGEAQNRTDRIVFKLFGKDPSDFPLALRKQILDWLSNSPTDIEGYIRPGCVVLTIYLRMDKSTWDELYCDLNTSLRRLLDSSTDSIWRTGWIYTRIGHRATFVYNGQVVLDTPLPLKNNLSCRISSIKPIAVAASESVQFEVKGFNLFHPTSRLQCSLEGNYLVQENCVDMIGGVNSFIEHDEIQSLSFSLVTPNIVGRGFIEVEDHGLSSSFFPFIVAEKDVCFEICTLESTIELDEAANRDTYKLEARNQALDFIHELGWLLHKNRLKLFRIPGTNSGIDLFSFKRFKWLIEFSIDQEWCAVVNKLLRILFDGTVDSGQYDSILLAILDIGLLHRAVRRNSRSMVEYLLKYNPNGALERKGLNDEGQHLFRPDAVGPGGLTPLHIAVSLDSCENVLDALTEDPGMVGIEAWKNARDSTGLTPHDYACFRGRYSYIHLVQRKLNKKSENTHIVLDIPGALVEQKTKAVKFAAFETVGNVGRPRPTHCGQCKQKMARGSFRGSLAVYRPAMLSMVAIAAVCVCAALLFKSSPEVLYSLRPFRWELLHYGAQ